MALNMSKLLRKHNRHTLVVKYCWYNSMPEQLRQPDITFGQFKRSLKTFMFG